jgi:hypothetical protein
MTEEEDIEKIQHVLNLLTEVITKQNQQISELYIKPRSETRPTFYVPENESERILIKWWLENHYASRIIT